MLNDRLVITSALTGKDITVTEITPFALAEKLGFGISDVYSPEKNPPTDSKADPIDSIYPMQFGFPITGWTWNEYDEQLPLRVIAFDLSARPLWIQGRDKNGEDQGLYIFLPHLSASRLKFSEYKVPEYEVTEELKGFSGVPTYKDKDDNEDVKRGLNVLTREDANSAIDTVQSALHIISKERSRFGAATNALEHMKSAVTNTHENLTAAESQIRDTDMAMAMAEFVKNNILLQATQAILAQANQAPQAILQLLR
jgi:flagellin-like hook-associated protein FlgL